MSFAKDGEWGGHLGRDALRLAKIFKRLAAVDVDAGLQMRLKSMHELRSNALLRWQGGLVTFIFRRVLQGSKEVEGWKGQRKLPPQIPGH